MDKNIFIPKRKSYMEIGEIFFWTATINKWQKLLEEDMYKDVIIDSLAYLSEKKIVDVFGFVLMPNHIHLIWRTNSLNGKETAQGSLLKNTAHQFKRMLSIKERDLLANYKVSAANKAYEFWQRDSLAIHLYTPEVAWQKLLYMHNNPCADHWKLSLDPCDYKYSTAKYYELNIKQFSFIKDLRLEF